MWRLVNTYKDAPTDLKVKIMDKFARKLINSGFGKRNVKSLLIHSVVCYMDKVGRSELEPDQDE